MTIQICHVLNALEAKNPLYGTKDLSKGAKTRVPVLADIQNFALRAHCVHGIPRQEVKQVEATGSVEYTEVDPTWVTGVPLTYTALAQFNRAYVQNEKHRDKVARAAEIKEAKADAKGKSKKRSKEEMEHNERNHNNTKKKRRRSGDTKQPTAHEPGAQYSTNKGRQCADRETAVPASPAGTAKTTTSERATTPPKCRRRGAPTIPEGIGDHQPHHPHHQRPH